MFGNVNEVLIKLRAVLEGKGFEDVQKETKKTQDSTKKLQDAFKGLLPALGAAAIVAAMKKMSDSAMQYALAVDSVNDITGAGSVQSSKWVAQAQYVGVSAQAVANGMAILGKNMVANQTIFERHGVAIKDNNGQLLSLEQVLGNVRDRAREMGNGAQKTALEMELMGRSGKELDDFLMATNEEMEGVARQAEKLGLVLDDVTLNSIEAQKREMNKLAMVGQSLGMELNKTLIPTINVLGSVALWAAQQFGKLVSISENHGRVLGRVFGNANQVRKETELYTKLLVTGKITQEQYNDAMAAMGSQVKDNILDLRNLGKEDTSTSTIKIDNTRKFTRVEQEESEKRKKTADDEAKAKIEANKKVEDSAKDTASAMSKAFLESSVRARFDWASTAEKIADAFLTKALTPIAKGINDTMAGFGDMGGVVATGIGGIFGGVAGLVVGGFTSLFGQQKSFAELVDEAFQRLSVNANKAIENIGKERSLAQKKLDVLGALETGEGGVYGGSAAEALGVVGLTEAQARKKLLEDLMATQEKELELRKGGLEKLQRRQELLEMSNDDLSREIRRSDISEEERRMASEFLIMRMGPTGMARSSAELEATKQAIANFDKLSELDILKQLLETRTALGIPAMASGGIVTKPTVALIGEAGPEAVVPLSGSGGGVAGININMTNTFSGVNWTDEAQKDAIAREMASRIAGYVDGTKRLPYGNIRRF